jgi:hypothetical protein
VIVLPVCTLENKYVEPLDHRTPFLKMAICPILAALIDIVDEKEYIPPPTMTYSSLFKFILLNPAILDNPNCILI